jgi:hypothetical protein
MTEDEAHEAIGAMLHTMSQPYRNMGKVGVIDAHEQQAIRSRAYQSESTERLELLRQAYSWLYQYDLRFASSETRTRYAELMAKLKSALE